MTLTETENQIVCKYCGSAGIVKCGSYGGVQRYLCKSCLRKFKADDHLFHMKVSAQIVGDTLNMYYLGVKISDIRRYLEQSYSYYPPRSVLHHWIEKYTSQAVDIFENYRPAVGNVWIVSESKFKLNRRNFWVYDITDLRTGFLLTSNIVVKRQTCFLNLAVSKACYKSKKSPKLIIAYMSYRAFDAVERIFDCETEHINRSRSAGYEINDESIIRFDAMVRDRTLILHTLRTPAAAFKFVAGWLIHYNYINNNKNKNEKTPAQLARIDYSAKSWEDICYLP